MRCKDKQVFKLDGLITGITDQNFCEFNSSGVGWIREAKKKANFEI
jgi:hypothetical protein